MRIFAATYMRKVSCIARKALRKGPFNRIKPKFLSGGRDWHFDYIPYSFCPSRRRVHVAN